MMGFDASDDQEPLGYIGPYPIHAATLLLIVHSVALVLATLLLAFGASGLLTALSFSSEAVLARGWVWQFLSYAFVHIPSTPFVLLFFAAEMYFALFIFGREVERFLGRRVFCIIYGVLILTVPAVLTLCGLAMKTNYAFAGSSILHFALFVSFATIYPNAAVFFSVPSKWMVVLILGGFGLFCVAYHDWSLLLAAWASSVVAYVATRMAGVGDGWNLFEGLRGRLARPVETGTAKTKLLSRGEADSQDALDSVDSVLEKISRHGMTSLTQGERATLERARASLLKRKGRGP
ncbi:hypothetical protein AYO41_03360 [Verrucomicrobia bacterium SCGC AG-212-E04]|nr:hypothetical protein AYO41_03360 [Verrucomicrobia bacterium SCGC AG-212-E04]